LQLQLCQGNKSSIAEPALVSFAVQSGVCTENQVLQYWR
jgi:hypothetical protein